MAPLQRSTPGATDSFIPLASKKKAARRALPTCYDRGSPEIAAQAPELLAGLTKVSEVIVLSESLVELAKHSNDYVRSAAFRALTACRERGGPEPAAHALELLDELTKDANVLLSQLAKDLNEFQALLACCETGGPELAVQALELLASPTQDSEAHVFSELFVRFAKDSNEHARSAVIQALPGCERGGPELAAQAVGLLDEPTKSSEANVLSEVLAELAKDQ